MSIKDPFLRTVMFSKKGEAVKPQGVNQDIYYIEA